MAEVVGGISGLTRKYLPVPQAADVGKYLKVDTNGNPVYYAETPGGVVTEAGANAANSIGADSGADISAKVTGLVTNGSTTAKGKVLLGINGGAAKLVETPDGTSNNYVANFSTLDGWESASGEVSVTSNTLVFHHLTNSFLRRDFLVPFTIGKYIAFSFTVTGDTPADYITVRIGGTLATNTIYFAKNKKKYIILPVNPETSTTSVTMWLGSAYSDSNDYTITLHGFTYGDLSINQGSVLMSSILPDRQSEENPIRLPDKIYAVVGRECNIYFANLVGFDPYLYYFDVVCDVGQQQNERWTFTPTEGGTKQITIRMLDKISGDVVHSQTSTIMISAVADGAGNPYVLTIGDSTTAGGEVVEELKTLMTADGAMDITLVGTKGATYKHEGINGYRVVDFFSVGSPFYIDGAFDFSKYINNNTLPGCDIVLIHLGINDVAGLTSAEHVDSYVVTTKTQLDAMIASMKTYNASIIIGIALTIPPSSSQDSFGASYGCRNERESYIRRISRWQKFVIDNYGDRSDENIYIVPFNTALDTVHNMQKAAAAPWNSRTSETTERQNNGVHPANIGYYQLADCYYAWIKSVS